MMVVNRENSRDGEDLDDQMAVALEVEVSL